VWEFLLLILKEAYPTRTVTALCKQARGIEDHRSAVRQARAAASRIASVSMP